MSHFAPSRCGRGLSSRHLWRRAWIVVAGCCLGISSVSGQEAVRDNAAYGPTRLTGRHTAERTQATWAIARNGDKVPPRERPRPLLAAPRRPDLVPDVPLSDVSAVAIVLCRSLQKQIRLAADLGDARVLCELRQHVMDLDELHPKQQSYLALLVDQSLSTLSARPEAPRSR